MASDAIFKYIKSHYSRPRCVTNTYEVSFSTNSGFADLIEWYSLYFGPVLSFKFKMAAQNGCPRHIENLLKWYLLNQMCQKKWSNFSFEVWQPIFNDNIFTVFWNHLDLQIQDGRPKMTSDAIFKYINSHFSRVRCVTYTYNVSFSTNSGFADLIFWVCLDFRIQNGGPIWLSTPYCKPENLLDWT